MDRNISLRTTRYGPLPDQEGDLYLPDQPNPPVVCLLHGGFWRLPHGRDQMTAVAEDLAGRGLAVWNLEYRRLGSSAGGWPGTFDDALAGVDWLARLAAEGVDLDLARVTLCGHSAGGHLALWVAAHRAHAPAGGRAPGVRVSAVVGQAPVADLARAFEMGVGGGAVGELLGGTPTEQPERYGAASPQALLPLNLPQLILHGTADDVVPIEIARDYARAARAAGDTVDLLELPGGGHMDSLDPASPAHTALRGWLAVRR